MSKCHEIEKLLWDYPDGPLSPADKQKVSDHLETCAACRAALATIQAVRESREADGRIISAVDPDAFDNRVMQKILKETAAPLRRKSDEGYPLRMALSVGLAAAITIFLVFSVSDMQDMTMMQDWVPVPGAAEGKSYDRMDIHLVPGEGRETTGKKAGGTTRGEDLKKETPAIPPFTLGAPKLESAPEGADQVPEKAQATKPSRTLENLPQRETEDFAFVPPPLAIDRSGPESLSMVEKKITFGAKSGERKDESLAFRSLPMEEPAADTVRSRMEESLAGTAQLIKQRTGQFSILSSPVTRPAPDSVNIDAIYLTDESVPITSQQIRASMSEVVVDTGMIQSAERPRSMLVTVEKMPVPVEIVPPEYPVWALKREISGVVWVKARVDKNGEVSEALIVSSSISGVGFEEASLEAARKSKYLPAEANGNKIPVWIIYPVKFIHKH